MPSGPAVSSGSITIPRSSPRFTPSSGTRRRTRRTLVDWIRVAFALALFAVAVLTVVPAPTYEAWLIGLVGGEGGHWLAPVALLAFLPGWRASLPGRVGVALGAAAAALFCLPLAQVLRAMPTIEAEVSRVWGRAPLADPSEASPRTAPVEFLDLYLGVPIGESRMRTLVYAGEAGDALRLDLYLPVDSTAPAPLLVIVHGGSWRSGDRTELPAMARYFAARGIAVAVPDYRLAPTHRYPAARNDLLRAVSYVRDRAASLGVDPSRVVYLGRSAGAQLALDAALSVPGDTTVRGAVSLYGPLDLQWGYANPGNPRVIDGRRMLRDYLGGTPADVPNVYEAASPVVAVGPRTPPTLLIHGLRDALVSPQHAERFLARMEWAGRPVQAIRLRWATHGCDAILRGPCGQITLFAVERFLAAVLR